MKNTWYWLVGAIVGGVLWLPTIFVIGFLCQGGDCVRPNSFSSHLLTIILDPASFFVGNDQVPGQIIFGLLSFVAIGLIVGLIYGKIKNRNKIS